MRQSGAYMVVDPEIFKSDPDALHERAEAAAEQRQVGSSTVRFCRLESISCAFKMVRFSAITLARHGCK